MKQLKFMHITKTGGTAIEVSANNKGIKWGRYDKIIANNMYQLDNPVHGSIVYLTSKRVYFRLREIFDWFVVVRDPYNRMISLVNWYRTNSKNYGNTVTDNVKLLQHFLGINKETSILPHIMGADSFTALPASDYVYHGDRKIVKHVLHHENLEQEFNQLMKQYNLNIQLHKDVNVSHKYMSRDDLTPELIQAINIKYKDDFKNFGYTMM
jgi:hypothetical protein